MVPAQDRNPILEAHFEADEEGDGLYGVVAAIDVISHEEVVCVWRFATNSEEFHQVVELTVDVSANSHWRANGLNVALLRDYFLSLRSFSANNLLCHRASLLRALGLASVR